jgi:hypothetical protein
MATCPDLATQLSELQSQLAPLRAELDNPEQACLDAGFEPGSDACTLYLKDLRRQAADDENQIASIQQQQQDQGCLPPFQSMRTIPSWLATRMGASPSSPLAGPSASIISPNSPLVMAGPIGSALAILLASTCWARPILCRLP